MVMKEASPETKKRNRWLKLLSAEFLVVFLLLIVAIIIFAYSVNMVFIKKTTSFDERIFNYVSGHVSSIGKLMVVINKKGKVEQAFRISALMFPQPEGITFSDKGDMYISNEIASEQTATLLKYKYTKPKN